MTKVVHEVVALAALGVVGYFAGAILNPSGEALAKNRYALEPPNVEARRAFRYARTEPKSCLEELDRRGFPYELEKPTKQVDTPMRIAGPVRGVSFALTKRAEPNPDPTSPAAILDCVLALAIDDFAKVLAAHDVVRVEYMSMYRTRGLGFIKPGRRHPSGRAIDVATLTRKDGKTFNVAYDFHGWPGAKTCGEGAAKPRKDTEGARLFRDVVCELSDMGSFNLLLTPHYDWGHRDHLHMEVRSDIRWFLIQ